MKKKDRLIRRLREEHYLELKRERKKIRKLKRRLRNREFLEASPKIPPSTTVRDKSSHWFLLMYLVIERIDRVNIILEFWRNLSDLGIWITNQIVSLFLYLFIWIVGTTMTLRGFSVGMLDAPLIEYPQREMARTPSATSVGPPGRIFCY